MEQVALAFVPGDHMQPRARQREHLRYQLAETPGAHQQDTVVGTYVHLLQDLDRRCQRLGEHRCLVAHGVRHHVQVLDRQRQVLGVRTVALRDAQHGARLAVSRASVSAGLARAAHGVDLAHHAPAHPRRVRRLDDLPTNSWPITPVNG